MTHMRINISFKYNKNYNNSKAKQNKNKTQYYVTYQLFTYIRGLCFNLQNCLKKDITEFCGKKIYIYICISLLIYQKYHVEKKMKGNKTNKERQLKRVSSINQKIIFLSGDFFKTWSQTISLTFITITSLTFDCKSTKTCL